MHRQKHEVLAGNSAITGGYRGGIAGSDCAMSSKRPCSANAYPNSTPEYINSSSLQMTYILSGLRVLSVYALSVVVGIAALQKKLEKSRRPPRFATNVADQTDIYTMCRLEGPRASCPPVERSSMRTVISNGRSLVRAMFSGLACLAALQSATWVRPRLSKYRQLLAASPMHYSSPMADADIMVSSRYKPCFGPANDADVCFLGLLPDELLLCIISYLEVVRGFLPDPEAESGRQEHNARTVRALHSITLTCRKLHAITTPFLYTSFVQSQNHLDATKLLQTTLCRQPKLAKHIRYCEIFTTSMSSSELPVSCSTSEWGTVASRLAAASWNIPEMGALLQRNKPLPWYEWDFGENETLPAALWQTFGRSQEEGTLILPIILIIALADNLGEVAMCHDIFISSALAFRRFSSSAGLRCLWLMSRPYQQDAIITIKTQPTAHHSPLQDYIRENCTSFKIREILYQDASLSQNQLNSNAALSELSLDIYDMESRFICGHLERCDALTRVSINWISHSTKCACYSYGESAQPIDHKPPNKPIELAVIGQALRKFTSTLQSLRVDTLDSGWLVDMETDIPALGSFRDFSRLANLEVSGLALWGDYNSLDGPDERLSSLLPPSITSLSIRTEWDDDVEHALHMLLPDCTELLPNLKRVECSWRPAPMAIADYLVLAFQEQGVSLILDVGED